MSFPPYHPPPPSYGGPPPPQYFAAGPPPPQHFAHGPPPPSPFDLFPTAPTMVYDPHRGGPPPPTSFLPPSPYGGPFAPGEYGPPPPFSMQPYDPTRDFSGPPRPPFDHYGSPSGFGGYGGPPPLGFDPNRSHYDPYHPSAPSQGPPYPSFGGGHNDYYPPAPFQNHGYSGSVDFQQASTTSFQKINQKFGASDHDMLRVNFFGHVRSMLKRDYTIVLDKSGSMAGSFWNQAKNALIKIAPFCCKADPDGVTLYLFSTASNRHPKYDHIKDPTQIEGIFSKERAEGTTDLGGVLEQVFDNHFAKGHNPETILVITDGAPDNKERVKRAIVRATQQLTCDEELSLSFIQIGSDPEAHRFLKELDSHLDGAKYDIVDEITMDQMGKLSFEELIEKSIID